MWYSTLINSSVNWACLSLNCPIGRLGPAPANGHLWLAFRRSSIRKSSYSPNPKTPSKLLISGLHCCRFPESLCSSR
jgi:hypothetical protein